MDSAKLSKKEQGKIIWAVDPTQKPSESKRLLEELKIWSKRLNCKVQPVAIIAKTIFRYPANMPFPWDNSFESSAAKYVNRYIKSTNSKGFLAPELVFVPNISNRRMAQEMVKYAESKNAVMIFANTRAKRTLNPFRLGGFVEALVASSQVPVLLVNSRVSKTSDISPILFPTDFGRDSKNSFLSIEPLVKTLNSEVLIYNQVEDPNLYFSEFDGIITSAPRIMKQMTDEIEKLRYEKSKEWSQLLAEQDLKCRVLVQRQKKLLSSDILAVANKNKVGLIAMASQTGPMAQSILGSISRDVLLQADCPVLIIHRPSPTQKRAMKSATKSSGTFTEAKEPTLRASGR